ncbi:MAG: dTMP kinase [Candidatus Binatia bacterium]
MSAFITFEGIEGCGKTTQARLLSEHLRATDREAVLTREPGGTELTEQIRALLADPESRLDRHAELLLFLADRAQHVASVIKPGLARGAVVISDRYSDSTIAYQGHGRGHDLDWLRTLNAWACLDTVPDLTLWIDCDIETGVRRAAKETGGPGDRFESEPMAFHRRVHAGFAAQHAEAPDRIVRIDGDATIQAIAADVIRVVEAHLAAGGVITSGNDV